MFTRYTKRIKGTIRDKADEYFKFTDNKWNLLIPLLFGKPNFRSYKTVKYYGDPGGPLLNLYLFSHGLSCCGRLVAIHDKGFAIYDGKYKCSYLHHLNDLQKWLENKIKK